MAFFKLQLCLLLFVVIFTKYTMCINRNAQKASWQNHVITTSKFKCEKPQPRAFELRELMDIEDIPRLAKVLPSSTILHRCDSAGCCPLHQKCTAVAADEVTLVFGIINRGLVLKEVTAINHTECACENSKDRPK